MKYKHVLIIIFVILIIDQLSKIYIKTNFYLGETIPVFGDWFKLCFIENEGMAFGMTISDAPYGKVALTLFRLIAVTFGFFWVKKLSKQGYRKGLMICASLILAGAAGNLIDSIFYGAIFTTAQFPLEVSQFTFSGDGYAPLLFGKVVDMLYFPLIEDAVYPQWLPIVGGKTFTFFAPIFNIADSAISVGIITLLFFQKRLLQKDEPSITPEPETQS